MQRRTPLRRSAFRSGGKGLRPRGKNAYVPPKVKDASGTCPVCGRWYERLSWDHVLKRSLVPGPDRDNPANLERVCLQCNLDLAQRKRRHRWWNLREETRAFVFDHKGWYFVQRYFDLGEGNGQG